MSATPSQNADPIEPPEGPEPTRAPGKLAAASLAGLAVGLVATGGRNTLLKLMALGGAAYAGKRLFQRQPTIASDRSPVYTSPDTEVADFLAPAPSHCTESSPLPAGFEAEFAAPAAPFIAAEEREVPTRQPEAREHASQAFSQEPSSSESGSVSSPLLDLSEVILSLRGSIHSREATRLIRPPSPGISPADGQPPLTISAKHEPAPDEASDPTPFARSPASAPLADVPAEMLPAQADSVLVRELAAGETPATHASDRALSFDEPDTTGSEETERPLHDSQTSVVAAARESKSWCDFPAPAGLSRSESLRMLVQAAAQLRSNRNESLHPPPAEARVPSSTPDEPDDVSVVDLNDEEESLPDPATAHLAGAAPQTTLQPRPHALPSSAPYQRPTSLPPPKAGPPTPFRLASAAKGEQARTPSTPSPFRPAAPSQGNPPESRPYPQQSVVSASPSGPPMQAQRRLPLHARTRLLLAVILITCLGTLLLWKLFNTHEDTNNSASPARQNQQSSDAPSSNSLRPVADTAALPNNVEGAAPASSSVLQPTLSASETLERFLSAATTQERMPYCLPVAGLTERMSSYPDQGPLGAGMSAPRHVPVSPQTETNNRLLLFELKLNESARTFPVFVYQTENAYAIDWQACVEFKDALLRRFCEGTFDAWDEFYAVLQRGHNYENAGEDETRHWFILSAPGSPGFVQKVFVERDSPLGGELDGRFEFQKEYEVVVRLERVSGPQTKPQLRVAGIPRYSWEP